MGEILHWDMAAEGERSTEFRRVLWTGEHTQLVIMTVPAGGEVGEETHEENDQLLSVVTGSGEVVIEGEERLVAAGDVVAVPAGTRHNVLNVGPAPLVLSTVYGPPEHAAGAVHRTKEEGEAAEESGQDEPPQG